MEKKKVRKPVWKCFVMYDDKTFVGNLTDDVKEISQKDYTDKMKIRRSIHIVHYSTCMNSRKAE